MRVYAEVEEGEGEEVDTGRWKRNRLRKKGETVRAHISER